MLFLALLASLTVHTDFEGGQLQKIEPVSPTHFRLHVKGETDQAGRNRQASWYYFRVDNAPRGQEVVFDLVDLPGEYNYQANRGPITKDTPPVISYDGKSWKHIDTVEYDPKEPKLTIRIRPEQARFWIAHVPPYTNVELGKLRTDARKNPDFEEKMLGPIPLWTIHHGPVEGKKTIWLMFRQHSWESGSSWVGEGAVRTLLSDEALRTQYIWKIFPMADPAGVHRGGVRFNGNGYDLNRNWDVHDPEKMPEITAQRDAVAAWLKSGHTIDLYFSLHNTETGEYLEGPPQGHRELAERFFQILKDRTTFAPTRPLIFAGETTTPGMKGRMTVIQGLNHDFKIPAFLMEQRIAFNSKLGHLPEVADRLKFGGELVRAMAEALR